MAKDKKDEQKKVKRPTAIKRNIQNKKRRLINRSFLSQVRTAIRRFEDHLSKGQAEEVKTSLNSVYSLMDKGVKARTIKPNTASRTKARLAAKAAKIPAGK